MSMRSATAKSIALLQPTRGRRGLIDGILTMARAYRQGLGTQDGRRDPEIA